MARTELDQRKRAVVADQVRRLLTNSASFSRLTAAQRREVEDNTIAVAQAIVANGQNVAPTSLARRSGPQRRLARGLEDPAKGPPTLRAQGIEAGVRGAGQLVREVDFVQFVTELVKGVFHSIVQSSMEQMKAYGELVRSVAMSLNEFRDQNVDEAQGHQHLVQRYPNVFQMNVIDGSSRAGVREDADLSSLPDFQADFGLPEEVSDLDDETIAQKLVPAARDSVAASRQKLLATMVLMGINRIIVTNGKINAKVRFDFKAKDQMTNTTVDIDREHVGDINIRQGYVENAGTALARDTYQQMSRPVITVASHSTTQTAGEVEASGFLMGEVSLNFKSETFPLEKMVNTNEMMRLETAQRGTVPAAAQAPASPAPASPVPAPAAPSPAPAR